MQMDLFLIVFVMSFESCFVLIREPGCCHIGFLEERISNVCSTANENKKWEHRQVKAVVCRDTCARWGAEAATEDQPSTQADIFCFSAELCRQTDKRGNTTEAGAGSSA